MMKSDQNGNHLAEATAKNTFNRRKFISVTLAFSMIVMLLAACAIQDAEAGGIENYGTLTTIIHTFSGLIFSGFLVAHLKMNWKAMKSYLTPKKAFMSKEVFYGSCISTIPIILALGLALWNPVSH